MPARDRLRCRVFLADEELKRDVRRQESLHGTEEAQGEPLPGRYEERGTLVVAETLPKALASEGRERGAMEFAKALRPEQALQRSRVKVRQVRRRKAALPQAFEVAVPETVEGLSAPGLVNRLVACTVSNGWRERGCEEAAVEALQPVAPMRTGHGGLADEAMHR